MRTMKKFAMLLTILVGTSLAVYAAVIIPILGNVYVSNITSTTASIHLQCFNTDYLRISAKTNVGDDYHVFDTLMIPNRDYNSSVECDFSIRNMQPDTPYYILIEAIGFEDPETGNQLIDSQSIFLRTAFE